MSVPPTYDSDTRRLLIHADDVGICHTANQATFDILAFGLVRSASLMMPCPWIHEAIAYYQHHPDTDFGLHLTVNSEWRHLRWGPVASRDRVPSLLDPDGCLWATPAETRAHAKSAEIEIELTAQIERALRLGVRPTHLDFHMGTLFLDPAWVAIATQLSDRYAIPLTLVRWSTAFGAREVESRGVPVDYMQRLLGAYEARGLCNIDDFISVVPGARLEERKAGYFDVLRNLRPGVTKLVIHPGRDSDEMRGMMKDADAAYLRRIADFQVFTDPETVQLIDRLGIRVINWKELAPRGR